jgi:hypothetical protein
VALIAATVDGAGGDVEGSEQRQRTVPLVVVRAPLGPAGAHRRFLESIEQAVPVGLDIHLVMDNYATHKTPAIRAWLARHPRYHVHFTPTSASWLNQIERWFALLTERQLRRWRASLDARARAGHQPLHHHPQCRPETVRMGQVRRRHPRQPRPLLRPNPRIACPDL